MDPIDYRHIIERYRRSRRSEMRKARMSKACGMSNHMLRHVDTARFLHKEIRLYRQVQRGLAAER